MTLVGIIKKVYLSVFHTPGTMLLAHCPDLLEPLSITEPLLKVVSNTCVFPL